MGIPFEMSHGIGWDETARIACPMLNFVVELYFDGKPIGWNGTRINCYEMGWYVKICPMDKPGDLYSDWRRFLVIVPTI